MEGVDCRSTVLFAGEAGTKTPPGNSSRVDMLCVGTVEREERLLRLSEGTADSLGRPCTLSVNLELVGSASFRFKLESET
jgi:hypothetical protein